MLSLNSLSLSLLTLLFSVTCDGLGGCSPSLTCTAKDQCTCNTTCAGLGASLDPVSCTCNCPGFWQSCCSSKPIDLGYLGDISASSASSTFSCKLPYDLGASGAVSGPLGLSFDISSTTENSGIPLECKLKITWNPTKQNQTKTKNLLLENAWGSACVVYQPCKNA